MVRILLGDVRTRLALLPADSVHCVVTSPPYWGLRDYGVAGQLGLEPTPDEHVAAMVEVFRAVRRVLRPDGVCWVNYGDSYAGSVNGRSAADTKALGRDDRTFRDKPFSTAVGGLKPKDLCMIPFRFALAMQADGWWLRSVLPWVKRNGMPAGAARRRRCAATTGGACGSSGSRSAGRGSGRGEGMITVIDPMTGERVQLYPTEELTADLKKFLDERCRHPGHRLCRATVYGGAVQYRRQCSVCGDLFGMAVAHALAPSEVAPEDIALREAYQAKRAGEHEDILQFHLHKQRARDAAWWSRYNAYLKSPEWSDRRAKVLRRAQGVCEGCLSRPATQVHHLTYSHVCEEFLFELVAMCEQCHDRRHASDPDAAGAPNG